MNCNPIPGQPVGAMPDGNQGCGPCEEGGLTSETLAELAGMAQTIVADGQQVTERSAADIIALDKYAAAKRGQCSTGGNAWGMLPRTRAIPPNPTTGC